jgi:glutathionylspermidine synthase
MLVFKQTNLKKIREATNNLFDIFHDVLEKDFEYGAYFSTKDIHNRLEQVVG